MMISTTTLEHNETAYEMNLRGFNSYSPEVFGSNPEQLEKYHEEIYGTEAKIITLAKIAGAAAYRAVNQVETNLNNFNFSNYDNYDNLKDFDSSLKQSNHHSLKVIKVREVAAQETLKLLNKFPLPSNTDPNIVILSAQAGAHRLYDHEISKKNVPV